MTENMARVTSGTRARSTPSIAAARYSDPGPARGDSLRLRNEPIVRRTLNGGQRCASDPGWRRCPAFPRFGDGAGRARRNRTADRVSETCATRLVAQGHRPPGCADRLAFEVDPADLRDPPVSAAEAERARGGIEAAFRRVASALCVAGTLPVTAFLMFDRVVLKHAEGAMEPTIYPGERPRTLVYELFDVYRRPVDEALLRDGLLCLASPEREGCYQD